MIEKCHLTVYNEIVEKYIFREREGEKMAKKLFTDAEIEGMNRYRIETDENGLVKLDEQNVYRVLAMISDNSAYCKVFDTGVKGILKQKEKKNSDLYEIIEENNVDDNLKYRDGFFGSSAYWFNKLSNTEGKEKEYKYYLYKVICAIDKENSTHLNADEVGRIQIWQRLIDKANNIEELKNCLLEDDLEFENNNSLVQIIALETKPIGKKPRRNISFASKFCHYACCNLLEQKYWDKYPIYDTIVKNALPFYVESVEEGYYSDCVIKAYKAFAKTIAKLSEDKKISKNGIDQLLWYYHKAHGMPNN